MMSVVMSESERLRERAARLLAMVLSVREHGFGSAEFLTGLANEALARAEDFERRNKEPPQP
jgi:hypothetical protein